MSNFDEFDQQGSVPRRDAISIITHAFEMYKGVFLYAIIGIVIYAIGDFLLQTLTGTKHWSSFSNISDWKRDYTDMKYWESSNSSYYFSTNILGILLSPLYVGLIYITNKFNNKATIEISDLFIGYRQNFLQIIFYTFLVDIILIISAFLCVVPMFLVFPLLLLGYPILLFENKNAIDSIKKSVNIAKDHYSIFLGTGLLGLLISISGILACCIGIIVTMPFIMVVMYSSYCAFLGKPRQIN